MSMDQARVPVFPAPPKIPHHGHIRLDWTTTTLEPPTQSACDLFTKTTPNLQHRPPLVDVLFLSSLLQRVD
jgi:hypothetical protein